MGGKDREGQIEVEPGNWFTKENFARFASTISEAVFDLALKGDPEGPSRVREIYWALLRSRRITDASPSVERIAELYQLMSQLSHMVLPAGAGRPDVLAGTIKLNPQTRYLVPEIYDAARRHWRPRTTLNALARRVYIERLDKEGFSIDERTLTRDMIEFRKWEAGQHEFMKAAARGEYMRPFPLPSPLPTYLTLQRWKSRKRAKKR